MFFFCSMVCANQIEKVYFHQNTLPHQLECATLVLYFSDIGQIKFEQKKNIHDKVQLLFSLPNLKITPELQEKFNHMHLPDYAVQLRVQGPVSYLTIDYNPLSIDVAYDTYTSMHMERGFVFRFFNQSVLSKMKMHHTKVLQVASLDSGSKKKLL